MRLLRGSGISEVILTVRRISIITVEEYALDGWVFNYVFN